MGWVATGMLILAAVTALGIAAMAAWRRRGAPRITLAIQESGEEPTNGPLSGPFIVVAVRNGGGQETAAIAACAIAVHRTGEVFREITRSNVALAPYHLQPGRRFRFWAEAADLAATLAESHRRGVVEIVGVCYDTAGREWRSRPLRFHVERHLRSLARAAK